MGRMGNSLEKIQDQSNGSQGVGSAPQGNVEKRDLEGQDAPIQESEPGFDMSLWANKSFCVPAITLKWRQQLHPLSETVLTHMEGRVFKMAFRMWQSLGKAKVCGGCQQPDSPVPLLGGDLVKVGHKLGKKVIALMGVKGAGDGPGP